MQKNDQKNDQEYYIDSVLKAVYIRDLESKKIYSPIYIREKLNSLEEYISHFKDIGLDLHDQQNYALACEIGQLTHVEQAGHHHNSGDFRTFCYTWYGNGPVWQTALSREIEISEAKGYKERFNRNSLITNEWVPCRERPKV